MKKSDWKSLSLALAVLSVLSVVGAFWGFMVGDVWLASTQWLLVAAVMGLWSVWAKLE